MKRALSIVGAVLLGAGAIVPSTNGAVAISVAVGDRPYYVHGPSYWVGPVRYVWVPGHYAWRHHHRVWVHGHYLHR